MKYIIMCGGTYQFPRHFTPILGEPVIARTIRLLEENGVDDLYISTNDERFSQYAPILRHFNDYKCLDNYHTSGGAWVNGFWPTTEPACYIFGDVVFSPEAIKTIVETETKSIDFFASTPPFDWRFVKKWAEPFAFKVSDQKRFRAAIDFVIANIDTGIFRRHPIAWELWQVINGKDVHLIDYDSIIPINDYTCDIDEPEDAPRIEAMICKS